MQENMKAIASERGIRIGDQEDVPCNNPKHQNLDDSIRYLSEVNESLRMLRQQIQGESDSEKLPETAGPAGSLRSVTTLENLLDHGPERINDFRHQALDQIGMIRAILFG